VRRAYFECLKATLLFVQGGLLLPLVRSGERYAGVGQGGDGIGECASPESKDTHRKKVTELQCIIALIHVRLAHMHC